MKKILFAMGVGGAAAAVILGTPQAHADSTSNQFVSYVESHANNAGSMKPSDISANDLVGLGYAVCGDVRNGNDPIKEAAYMATHGFSVNDAEVILGSAIGGLCPDQDYKLGVTASGVTPDAPGYGSTPPVGLGTRIA